MLKSSKSQRALCCALKVCQQRIAVAARVHRRYSSLAARCAAIRRRIARMRTSQFNTMRTVGAQIAAQLTADMQPHQLEQLIEQEIGQLSLSIRELDALGCLIAAQVFIAALRICSPDALNEAIAQLSLIDDVDFFPLVQSHSRAAQLLGQNAHYASLDKPSRAHTLQMLAEYAYRHRQTEESAATALLKISQDKGIPMPTLLEKRRAGVGIYCTLSQLCALLPAAAVCLLQGSVLMFPLVYTAFYTASQDIFQRITARKPRFCHRADEKIVLNEEVVVVISLLVCSLDDLIRIKERLVQLYHSNGRGKVRFCLLADLENADVPTSLKDEVIASRLSRMIDSLNKRYGQRFVAILRPRTFCRTEHCFCAWERKRGAIEQLVKFIYYAKPLRAQIWGDVQSLRTAGHMLVLDADTHVKIGDVQRMLACALSPANRPVIAPDNSRVLSGYGIISPRFSIRHLREENIYQRYFAAKSNDSLYNCACADSLFDMTGQTVFQGKGIINIEAYAKVICSRFPEQRILSHDFPEGALLRTGLASDVVFSETEPSTFGAHLARAHRWIRGDWQNLFFLRPDRHRLSLPLASSYVLLSNLISSCAPIAQLALLLAASYLNQGPLLLATLISLCLPQLLSLLSEAFSKRNTHETVQSAVRILWNISTLPLRAINSADAIIRALWRQFVSRRHMLQWRTAAQGESGRKSDSFSPREMLTLAFSLPVVLCNASVLADAVGLLFAVCPMLDRISRQKIEHKKARITDRQRADIRHYARIMWSCFADNVTKKTNHLPPDNITCGRVAMRTSPTNIGMYMLSVLSACDMGIISRREMLERIVRTTTSLEKMEKWHGHLLNWYNISTLAPEGERIVSSVDSGNLVASLIALKQGLIEYNAASELLARIESLVQSADFAALYNPRRECFYTAYSLERNCYTRSCYDMHMSEARITSFVAIALGQVPPRHYAALRREYLHTAPISWTGTMFEYLMPNLFLPVEKNTLEEAAVRSVLNHQRRYALLARIPWGISESSCAQIAPNGEYHYKAHSLPALAVHNNSENELVVAPYAVFLALPHIPSAALRNLARMKSYSPCGSYGLHESLDFTAQRAGGGCRTAQVYMAHHVGMSIISCAQALGSFVNAHRFMRDERMCSAKELLLEPHTLSPWAYALQRVPVTVFRRNCRRVWLEIDGVQQRICERKRLQAQHEIAEYA